MQEKDIVKKVLSPHPGHLLPIHPHLGLNRKPGWTGAHSEKHGTLRMMPGGTLTELEEETKERWEEHGIMLLEGSRTATKKL
jgi:hypothetical protein